MRLLILTLLHHTCAGFGVDQLRDDNLETYWQSDGSQPHLVNIQFRYQSYIHSVLGLLEYCGNVMCYHGKLCDSVSYPY